LDSSRANLLDYKRKRSKEMLRLPQLPEKCFFEHSRVNKPNGQKGGGGMGKKKVGTRSSDSDNKRNSSSWLHATVSLPRAHATRTELTLIVLHALFPLLRPSKEFESPEIQIFGSFPASVGKSPWGPYLGILTP